MIDEDAFLARLHRDYDRLYNPATGTHYRAGGPLTNEEALAVVEKACEEMRLSRVALEKRPVRRSDTLLPGWLLAAIVVVVTVALLVAAGVNAYRTLFPAVPTYTVCVQVDQAGHVLPGRCETRPAT